MHSLSKSGIRQLSRMDQPSLLQPTRRSLSIAWVVPPWLSPPGACNKQHFYPPAQHTHADVHGAQNVLGTVPVIVGMEDRLERPELSGESGMTHMGHELRLTWDGEAC